MYYFVLVNGEAVPLTKKVTYDIDIQRPVQSELFYETPVLPQEKSKSPKAKDKPENWGGFAERPKRPVRRDFQTVKKNIVKYAYDDASLLTIINGITNYRIDNLPKPDESLMAELKNHQFSNINELNQFVKNYTDKIKSIG